MRIVLHPATFLQHLPPPARRQAMAELEAIRKSNPGSYFNLLASLFRQTRYPTVRAALERHFHDEIRRRLGVVQW